MGQDYYVVLGLTRSCTDADIKKAYRKLALKYHPHKNQEPGSDLKFKQVAEVYDVLSNYQLRAIYDQFGEEGLKNGIPNIEGGFTKGYVFHGDAEKVFKEFFGGENPFLEMYEISPHDVEIGMFGGLKGRGQRKQDAAIERDLYLTLEEVYHGCIKKMKITRRVMNEDGHSSSIRDKILTINVKPGWRAGTKIIFSKEGDQGPNNIPADIIFLIKDKPHVLFQRDGDNVIYTASVTLKEALIGCIVDVPTLDGRVLSIPVNEIICHGYKKVVENEGMPISKRNNRGDLVILFNIIFPQRLTSEQKDLISQALG
ncbi:dnaJ homolog subfamily B member 13 isoform X2 [Hydra vulgaris]|uniref:DnaJ homolog subfamily B member 13 isoform X2 n=1 Tax=Hydra vulgaris TaxID=6087 RepID=A0ABM4BLX7_HYDVU